MLMARKSPPIGSKVAVPNGAIPQMAAEDVVDPFRAEPVMRQRRLAGDQAEIHGADECLPETGLCAPRAIAAEGRGPPDAGERRL